MRANRRIWIAGLFITLLIAGGLSYLASSSPDGLDSATLRGCEVVERGGSEQLVGQCIARDARDHALSGSPLADYTVGGAESAGGVAGVIGVAVTLVVAGTLFWILARGRTPAPTTADRRA
jgi:cobalt/nickel transport protein